ncbi:MAG: hypothetical protein KDB24_16465, partial [Microthrixaceae bacterium]|nr:hypothetical protein [Microthrixaceae bacterium]
MAKVRSGEPLTPDDIAELQRILVAAGLDRAAAKGAFAQFLDDKRYIKSQIDFVNLIIDELASEGIVEPGRIYEQPYIDMATHGPEQIF